MPRKRRSPKTRRAEISPDMLALLSDREPNNAFVQFVRDDERRAAWTEAREEILAEWITDAPGTRPIHWWRFDAPRQPFGKFPGCYFDGKLPEPRERLGGVGTPSNECLAYTPTYAFGIPDPWITRADVECYSPDFEGVAIDPKDPPRYESQAAYLRRLDLLLPGELKRLTPADFEPELVMPEEDDETEAADDAA